MKHLLVITLIVITSITKVYSQDQYKRIDKSTGTEQVFSSVSTTSNQLPDSYFISIVTNGSNHRVVTITESLNHYIVFVELKDIDTWFVADKSNFKFLDEKTKLYKHKDLSLVLQEDQVYLLHFNVNNTTWYNMTIGKSFPDLNPTRL